VTGAATTGNETPAFIPAGADTLFGILTTPTVEPVGTTVVAMPALVQTPGFGRETTYLCRRAAAAGYHAVRFDYHGMGDSTGVVHRMHLDDLFIEDLEGMLGWLRARGLERYALVGNCFGSRTALALAPRMEGLAMLALAAPPIQDIQLGERREIAAATRMTGWQFARKAVNPRVLGRMFNRRRRRRYAVMARTKLGAASGRVRPGGEDRWVSQPFLRDLMAVVQRGIPTLLLYGDQDDFYQDFQRARTGRLGRLLENAGDLIEVRTLPGLLHEYRDTERQHAMQDLITEWIVSRDGGGAAGGRRGGDGTTAAAAG
jgi:pimeloyl-ACP methyl ester carboxylesterase